MGETERTESSMRFCLLIAIFIFGTQIFAANEYQVIHSIGEPVALVSDSNKINLSKKTILNQDFKIQSTEKQFVKIILNQNFELSIFNDTEILIQSIFTSDGYPSTSVQLAHGQIAFRKIQKNADNLVEVKKTKLLSKIRLSSGFFEWDFDQDSKFDFWAKFDEKKPNIEFCNREKNLEVVLFDHEKKINLTNLEGVIFDGEFMGDADHHKIAYDILLKGRKIPKGHWLEKIKCSFDQVVQQEKLITEADHLVKKNANMAVQKIKNLKILNDSKFLCHLPYGQLHDCAWIKSAGQCVRTRCNAEGKWSDSQIIVNEDALKCTPQFAVHSCDY